MGFAQNMRITAHADYQSTKTYAQPNTRRKIAPFCFQLSAGNTQNKKSRDADVSLQNSAGNRAVSVEGE